MFLENSHRKSLETQLLEQKYDIYPKVFFTTFRQIERFEELLSEVVFSNQDYLKRVMYIILIFYLCHTAL